MNIYEARWRNALKIALRINDLIARGYVVRDEEDTLVLVMNITEVDQTIYRVIDENPNRRIRELFFQGDKEYDHGAHTTITEFNARFHQWKVYHPSAARPLIRGRK